MQAKGGGLYEGKVDREHQHSSTLTYSVLFVPLGTKGNKKSSSTALDIYLIT